MNKNDYLILITFFFVGFLLFFSMRYLRINDEYAIQSNLNTSIYIQENQKIEDLANKLDSLGLINNIQEFVWVAKINGYRRIQLGHYEIKAGNYSIKKEIKKFVLGAQDPIKYTIIPGQTKERIIQSLAKQFKFSEIEFNALVSNDSILKRFNISQKQVLGRLLPNTYENFWTAKPIQVFSQLNNELIRNVNSYKSTHTIITDLNDIVTLASIVEWEAGSNEEKKTIAGLYLNRLKRRWRLQADPTVNFALGERRRLLYEDYQYDHPYNTYKIYGLPPGPISNPDLESIKAVLQPENHSFMYMVATPEGVHDFSRTFAEHQEKSKKWTRWLRKQYRIKRQRESQESGR